MKKCSYCGKTLEDTYLFCPHCGKTVKSYSKTNQAERKMIQATVIGICILFLLAMLIGAIAIHQRKEEQREIAEYKRASQALEDTYREYKRNQEELSELEEAYSALEAYEKIYGENNDKEEE